MRDAKALEETLLAIVHTWLFPIDANCEQQLTQLIQTAARDMERKALLSNSAKLLEAEHNLRALLTQMTWQAGAQGFDELHEPTLGAALRRLCPLFPFC
jgi:hypothetical protein